MKYNELRRGLKKKVFTRQDLRLRGFKVFDYQLSLWQKQGYILKLKNGVYLFADAEEQITPEEIAGSLYGPSYLSLESALSFYGMIPEMVYAVTSITSKTTRRIKTKFGDFIFRHVKPALFFGYKEVKSKNSVYLMAEPEKALVDYLYLNNISTPEGLKEMRLNQSLVKKLNHRRLLRYADKFNLPRIKRILKEI